VERAAAASACRRGPSALLDLDLALSLHGLGLLGGRDLEHALGELGLDLRVVNGVRQADGALEAAKAALRDRSCVPNRSHRSLSGRGSPKLTQVNQHRASPGHAGATRHLISLN
jgi:hypothetical protein